MVDAGLIAIAVVLSPVAAAGQQRFGLFRGLQPEIVYCKSGFIIQQRDKNLPAESDGCEEVGLKRVNNY